MREGREEVEEECRSEDSQERGLVRRMEERKKGGCLNGTEIKKKKESHGKKGGGGGGVYRIRDSQEV